MKILSDFDGVLTDLSAEAARVRELFEHKVREAGGLSAVEANALFSRAEQAMREHPLKHGWRMNGRITAFWDEDGFVHTNALAACLEELEPVAKNLPYTDLAQQAYLSMAEETAAGKMKPVDPIAGIILSQLTARGVEVVIVSNSGTERVCRLLEGEGLSPVPHTDGGKPPLRVRGHAGKYRLGHQPSVLSVGAHRVDIDRPDYRTILLEEKPDVVIGDVFSLDLALPLALASQNVPGFAGVRLCLRRRPYTPAWVIEYLSAGLGREVSFGILDRFDQLLELA